MNKTKKFLFLTGTHGDEKIGIDVIQKIEKEIPKNNYDWIIANKKAADKNLRYIDTDLNRSAPGNKSASSYESRRAAEILELAKSYEATIDIHGTTADSGIFIIITNPTPQNFFLTSLLPIDNIVIWASKKSKRNGPLTQFIDCAIEIECGPKNSENIKRELFDKLKSFLLRKDLCSFTPENKKNFYQVYGKLSKSDAPESETKKLKDFQKTAINGESFHPLLANQYNEFTCYKMKKIDFFDFFSYS